MRTLLPLLLLLFGPPGARAATPPPELLCDPDAKITFQSRWLRESSVLLAGDVKWELPWTGKEQPVTGDRLKAQAPEALTEVADDATFVAFQKAGGPLETSLYIQRELLLGSESDGIVIAELLVSSSIEGTTPRFRHRLYHCRSR